MKFRNHSAHGSSRLRVAVGALATLGAATFFVSSLQARDTDRVAPATPVTAAARAVSTDNTAPDSLPILDSLAGISGKLRAVFLRPSEALEFPMLRRLIHDTASGPSAASADAEVHASFTVFQLVPFAAKVHGRIGQYRLGTWPYEHGTPRNAAYANPRGFIEVTRSNARTSVSEHFRLGDFLTKNQATVWPKYLVLRPQLLDKLELVIEDLNAHGIPVRHMAVMSGFRTPEYNAPGVGAGGRAKDSRHQYGDAADVFVDNDGDGWMDDLNHDGRVDSRDAHVLLDAANRVEAAHPEVVGGVGVYKATSVHGPFTHIDVRGYRARWGLI
ncbi:MAG TPA: hypothetical protein VFK13_01985 [Gemmatimonadaceae bacterium]|nr:hypothetical protein [Gemmatimonadaceae bacterium]